MKSLSFLFALVLPTTFLFGEELLFREDFKEVEAHIPAVKEDLTSPFLGFERLGPGESQIKLSYHPEIPNDPHYLWNGLCPGPVLMAFPFKEVTDLSASDWVCRLNTKNFGKSTLHLSVRSGGRWYAQKKSVATARDWNDQSLPLHSEDWFELDPKKVTLGKQAKTLNFKAIDAIGFAAPVKADGSKDCIRLNWFELVQDAEAKNQASLLPKGEFLENETPFLRSALVFTHEGETHLVRRGVLVPLHHDNLWACFDPDLLRWVVVWKAPTGRSPISYDSMASVSFPDKKAKASKAPRLKGEVLLTFPKNPYYKEQIKDTRQTTLIDSDLPVGPSATGRWEGITLSGKRPILNYTIGGRLYREQVSASQKHIFENFVDRQREPGFSAGHSGVAIFYSADGQIHPSAAEFPEPAKPEPIFPETFRVKNPQAKADGPFAVRNQTFPNSGRPIRSVDIAFQADGTALVLTLDGDVWQVKDIESDEPAWTRVATGIFEPMAIEVSADGKVYTLGRDQITQLMDSNNDGHFDIFRNASDAFLQTIHTRDYATSLAVGADGSFYLGKGGITNIGAKGIEDELSAHRGTILHITADGMKATVLADGLRLPFVGLRNDGTVFASDQQGHFIPSTPLHILTKGTPYLGFEPTNFRKAKSAVEPLLWYPYQANRSAAGFCTTSSQAFPDLANTFLQVSWNGRLFAIETPEKGLPFSWQLPLQLDFPALNGASHPQSGRLYVTGLGISGYKPTTPELVGLASIEQTQPFPTPKNLAVESQSIAVRFNRPFTAKESIIPGNPLLRLFNVHRTPNYGSGHYLWNDKPGEHLITASKFAPSSDGQQFVMDFDVNLRRSDVFDLQLNITSDTTNFPIHLYTRPHHLPEASSRDLKALEDAERDAKKLDKGDAAVGKPLFTQYACSGCHALDGQKLTGPPLNGVAGRLDVAKLRESILNPTAEIAPGYEPSMPSFEGVIPPQDLEHLLEFLRTLK
ncbi:cytochrome c [Roseibacillus persicicus]|uniref:DUF6797 domain-containing protein n=1 Tax=Roseibacillus persicicus TaxID=454148 RepID=UPI00398A8220